MVTIRWVWLNECRGMRMMVRWVWSSYVKRKRTSIWWMRKVGRTVRWKSSASRWRMSYIWRSWMVSSWPSCGVKGVSSFPSSGFPYLMPTHFSPSSVDSSRVSLLGIGVGTRIDTFMQIHWNLVLVVEFTRRWTDSACFVFF